MIAPGKGEAATGAAGGRHFQKIPPTPALPVAFPPPICFILRPIYANKN
jgi:hypothetical protein